MDYNKKFYFIRRGNNIQDIFDDLNTLYLQQKFLDLLKRNELLKNKYPFIYIVLRYQYLT